VVSKKHGDSLHLLWLLERLLKQKFLLAIFKIKEIHLLKLMFNRKMMELVNYTMCGERAIQSFFDLYVEYEERYFLHLQGQLASDLQSNFLVN